MPDGPDGICLDEEGAVWAGFPIAHEFRRIAPGGEVLDRIPMGERLAIACTLGGEDLRTLFLLSSLALPGDAIRGNERSDDPRRRGRRPGNGLAVTAAELFFRHADSDHTAAHFEDRSFTYRELATEASRRADVWERVRDSARPPHIGVLLDNTPEYLFWLGAAAVSRSVIVGINATYRGAELARLIDHCDCQVLVTSDRPTPTSSPTHRARSTVSTCSRPTRPLPRPARHGRRRPPVGAGRRPTISTS